MQLNKYYFINYFKTLNTSWVLSKNLKKYPGFFFFIYQLLKFKQINSTTPILCFTLKKYVLYTPFFIKVKKLKFFTKIKQNKIIYRFI
jgi:hypothetical protein